MTTHPHARRCFGLLAIARRHPRLLQRLAAAHAARSAFAHLVATEIR